MPEEVVQDSRTNDDLDKLADNTEIATNRSGPSMSEEPKAPAKETKTAEDGFEFVHNGKQIKATREQLLKWAQQGYDYPQRAQKLNQEKAKWEEQRQGWEKQRQGWEKQWSQYKQIDEFAQKNKDWWNHIVQGWNSRGQMPQGAPLGQSVPDGQNGTAQTPQYDQWGQKLQTLEQKLSQIEPLLTEFQQERIQSKEKAEDDKLGQEIQSLREKHSDLDWDSLDENGKTLELKILEHAQQNGISTFRAAMRDLLHDELVMKAESSGKLAIAKGIQNKTKMGVLGESPTPMGRMSPKSKADIRKTSYEQLQQEAMEELRTLRG